MKQRAAGIRFLNSQHLFNTSIPSEIWEELLSNKEYVDSLINSMPNSIALLVVNGGEPIDY